MKKKQSKKILEVKWPLEKIKEMVLGGEITPYIKPTRRKHDSGFGVFEVGYCKSNGGYVTEKMILGERSDHIYFTNMFDEVDIVDIAARKIGAGYKPRKRGKGTFHLNMDLTLDGYIRFFRDFKWMDDTWALSSMEFTFLNK